MECVSALHTSILSLIKLPSGRKKWQVQQHKDKQQPCVLTAKVAEAVAALLPDPRCVSQIPQSHRAVAGQSWPERCSVISNSEKT